MTKHTDGQLVFFHMTENKRYHIINLHHKLPELAFEPLSIVSSIMMDFMANGQTKYLASSELVCFLSNTACIDLKQGIICHRGGFYFRYNEG